MNAIVSTARGITEFSDALLVGLLAVAFALSDGLAHLILGLCFVASFAAFVAAGYKKQSTEGSAAKDDAGTE